MNEQAILPKLYPGRIVIPEPVYNELSRPQIRHLKQRIDVLKKNGQVMIVSLQHGSSEYALYLEMTDSPRKGEASVIALAKENNGIVASNNLCDIMQYISEFKLDYKTAGDIMVEAYNKELITETEGNIIWASMLAKRRKLGADSFLSFWKINSPGYVFL